MQELHAPCVVVGCGKKHRAKGYCGSHYAQFLRGITPSEPIAERDRQPPKFCKVSGCERGYKAKGYCKSHYRMFLRGLEQTKPIDTYDTNPPEHCTADDCTRPVHSKKLCSMHYVRVRKSWKVKDARPNSDVVPCSVSGCDGRQYAKALCYEHYRHIAKLKQYGITEAEYDGFFMQQNGLCALCLQPETATHRVSGNVLSLAIDHCHNTGKVRGLLCKHCNQAIGLLKHSTEILNRAVAYLAATA